MLKQLNKFLDTKRDFIFDFDRTIAKIEIDWREWFSGISEIYARYDQNHGFKEGKNPHLYHNKLVATFGDELLEEAQEFNRTYETNLVTGFVPNEDIVTFITQTQGPSFHIFSSNSMPTILRGLEEIGLSQDMFESIITKDDVRFVKPNPEGFSLIESFSPKNKDQYVMIGDSAADRGAAEAEGIDFLECTLFEKYLDED